MSSSFFEGDSMLLHNDCEPRRTVQMPFARESAGMARRTGSLRRVIIATVFSIS